MTIERIIKRPDGTQFKLEFYIGMYYNEPSLHVRIETRLKGKRTWNRIIAPYERNYNSSEQELRTKALILSLVPESEIREIFDKIWEEIKPKDFKIY